MAKLVGWIAVGALVVGGSAACSNDHNTPAAGKPSAAAKTTPAPKPTASTTPSPKHWYDDYDPAHFALQVRTYCKVAGINPQLLMAILYNESYKPHDPEFERGWAGVDTNPSFGIANMHKAAFDDTKRGRPFANRKWEELPDDPALAIEAAAWYLHDLAKRLPSQRSDRYTKDELLALGYNTGVGNMRLFARGRKAGPQAQTYLSNLRDNWSISGAAVKG